MNKKGFTLIELLAVIVILAVIALIVTPIVTGIISQAKESANARSVEGHIKNVEYKALEAAFKNGANTNAIDGTYENEAALISKMTTAGLEYPESSDKIVCGSYTISNGTVTSASGCYEKSSTNTNAWGYSFNYAQGTNATKVAPSAESGS